MNNTLKLYVESMNTSESVDSSQMDSGTLSKCSEDHVPKFTRSLLAVTRAEPYSLNQLLGKSRYLCYLETFGMAQ